MSPGEKLALFKRALRWYAWPDRYMPRFEGVGRAGIGVKYRPDVETDLGGFAREVLGNDMTRAGDNMDRLKEAESHLSVTRRILQQIRNVGPWNEDHVPKTAFDWGSYLAATLPKPVLRHLVMFLARPRAVSDLTAEIIRQLEY